MADETIPPATPDLAKLLNDVRAIGELSGTHLQEEQLIDFACEALPASDLESLERHLATCVECTERVARLLDMAHVWKGDTGGARLALLRERAREAGILASLPATGSAVPFGEARHPSRRELAWYRADPSRATAQLRQHIDDERCQVCLSELDSAAVRAMARLLAAPGAATRISALWDALLWRTPGLVSSSLRAATPGGSLLAAPSTLNFGGAQERTGAEEPLRCFVAPPKAYATTALYTSNGRELPDEAEVFWGHEIWLIQVSWSVAPGNSRAEVDAIGLSLRFPGQVLEVIDLLPNAGIHRATSSAAAAADRLSGDVRWNGRISEAVAALPLDADVLPLDFGNTLQLSSAPSVLGRLSLPAETPGVRASAAGIGEALWVLEASRPFAGDIGTVWVTAVTDKHLPRIDVEAQLWVEVKGLNGVSARLTPGPVMLPVTVVTQR